MDRFPRHYHETREPLEDHIAREEEKAEQWHDQAVDRERERMTEKEHNAFPSGRWAKKS